MNIEDLIKDSVDEMVRDVPARSNLADDALRRARRRQHVTRLTVAGCAAVALTGSAVLATSAGDTTPSTDRDRVALPAASSPDEDGPDILPAPPARDLTEAELAQAFETCRDGVDGEGGAYDGWSPSFGVAVDASAGPHVPTIWVAMARGDQHRADCALNSSGEMVQGGGEYGVKSTPALLYAMVDGQEGLGVGRLVEPVAQVTVQAEGEPEQEAVLQGGFWFFPIDEQPAQDEIAAEMQRLMDEGMDEVAAQEKAIERHSTDLIGVEPSFTFRGYDADGEIVYDSTTDGPSVEDCYADPSGTEFVGNSAGHADPADCVRTHAWRPLP